jgi:hypothetical protein
MTVSKTCCPTYYQQEILMCGASFEDVGEANAERRDVHRPYGLLSFRNSA